MAALDPKDNLENGKYEYFIFQYDYFSQFDDKIYYSNLTNFAIPDMCIKGAGDNYNDNLAGDIMDEFRIENPYAIEAVKEELKIHVSSIFGKRINSLSLKNPDAALEKRFDNLWINYQKPGEFNPSHTHTGKLSFVIYANIPEEIRQEHKDAYSPKVKNRGCIQFNSKRTNEMIVFNPRDNDIFIFTSDHMHQVYPFYSDNKRVTIAGNIYDWSY